MKKSFFINGGAGRVLCAIPALEHYALNTDRDVIIVSEAWTEIFALSPTLRNNVYPANHKNLVALLKDTEVISPEPYRLNAYFNQKVNLIQAFDMLINYDTPPSEFPKTKSFNLESSAAETAYAKSVIAQIKKDTGKSKLIVFQPLGSSARAEHGTTIDPSGRSFEHDAIISLAKSLTKDYAVIMMTNIEIPVEENMGVALLNNTNLLHWAGIIGNADYFLGCDSIGQHYANALGVPATVVIGATFPENISYPSNPNFDILDLGKGKRLYSPIRINTDAMVERNNESLMRMTSDNLKSVLSNIKNKIGK